MSRSLRFIVTPGRLGHMLLAAGERGICHLRFGDDPADLEERFRAAYPGARRAAADHPLQAWSAALVDSLEVWDGQTVTCEIPLDLSAGTDFQRRVWAHLRTIPSGESHNYRQVARAVGSPLGARAVASACAANPIALLVPCHRVVPASGGPGGYRWGAERKRWLLAGELGARDRKTRIDRRASTRDCLDSRP